MGWLLRGAGRRARRGRGGRACRSARTARGWPPEPRQGLWANAAAPPELGRGICLPPVGGKGARAGPPSSTLSGSCQSLGSARHPAGLREETLPGVAALLKGTGKSRALRGSRAHPRRVSGARTPNRSGLRREGAAAGPAVRARERAVIPGDWSAPEVLRPPALAA